MTILNSKVLLMKTIDKYINKQTAAADALKGV